MVGLVAGKEGLKSDGKEGLKSQRGVIAGIPPVVYLNSHATERLNTSTVTLKSDDTCYHTSPVVYLNSHAKERLNTHP